MLRSAAGWTWRLLVVGAGVYLTLQFLARVSVVTFAVVAALLLAALLAPLSDLLRRYRVPRTLAATVTLLALLGVLVLAGALIWRQAAAQFDNLEGSLTQALGEVRDWLVTGPLQLDPGQIDRLQQGAVDGLPFSGGALLSGATTAAEALSGLVLCVFVLFFFLRDGEAMWAWAVRLVRPAVRPGVDLAGREAWRTLTAYTRGVVAVAVIDAVLIGLGLLVLGVPLVLPLAVLTFFGAFVPIIGATLAGAAAVLVALVSDGVGTALAVLAVVLVVQQVEGNLLQPLIMKRAVHLHPVAIVLAVSAGTLLAGIPGAIIATPLVAVGYRVTAYARDGFPAQPGISP